MSGSPGSRRWRPLAALLIGAVTVIATIILPAGSAGAQGAAQVLAFGAAPDRGGPGKVASPVVGLAATPTGGGYWVATAAGGVHAFGDADPFGSTPTRTHVVDIAASHSGRGYWLATADGDVLTFGDARDWGSPAGSRLNRPIVGMAATPSGRGYWLVGGDGGIFSFGDADFHGSTGAMRLNSPIVGMAAAPDGAGYWMVAADGGIFTFGSARYAGSLGGEHLASPVVGMAALATGDGYWLATAGGAVRGFGAAADHGAAESPGAPVGDLAARPTGDGYWLVTGGESRVQAESTGAAVSYQPSNAGAGEPPDADFNRLAQCESTSRWNLDAGNGYYGGLQFSAATWRSLGGAGLPHERSREEQIDIARRSWRQQRWRAWPSCSRQLGLR